MVLPLQIRITEREARLTAAAVPYGVSMVTDLEFAFLVDVDGEMAVMSPYEFACHKAACRPPTSGGTGGSDKAGSDAGGDGGDYSGVGIPGDSTTKTYAPKAGYAGAAEHDNDMAIVIGRDKKGVLNKPGTIREDGILAEPWLDKDGNVVLSAKDEAKAHAKLAEMGTSYQNLVDNAKQIMLNSMNEDPARAAEDAAWYKNEHDTWGLPLAKEHGISLEQVMGIAAATSTNKKWDGVESNNKETVENILRYLKEDKPITVTAEQAKEYADFSQKGDSTGKGGGRYGARTIEPGEYKLSELSSGTLGRLMGSGYKIGGQYYTDGLVKAFAIARGDLSPNVAIASLKQRSFLNNLSHPEIDHSSTNDFWMVRALLGDKPLNLIKGREPMTVRQWEAETGEKPNGFIGTRGTGTSSLFAIMTKASKQALAELQSTDPRFKGMITHEAQAVSWVQMQREYAAAGLSVDE